MSDAESRLRQLEERVEQQHRQLTDQSERLLAYERLLQQYPIDKLEDPRAVRPVGVAGATTALPPDPPASEPIAASPETSRRQLLRTGVVAVGAGAAAATILPRSAAAATDGNMIIGRVNDANSTTRLNSTSAEALVLTCAGISGTTLTVIAPNVGSNPWAVRAISSFAGYAIVATGQGTAVGISTSGERAPLELAPQGVAPPLRSTTNSRGFIVLDQDGDLWLCVAAGTPGTWRKVAGPTVKTGDELSASLTALQTTVGSLKTTVSTLELVTPFRAYDSRTNMTPTESGPLPIGASRVIPVRDARDVATGAVVTSNAVPAGATGVVYTISTIAPSGSGFLTVVPKEAIAITAATINFDATSPTVLNNTSTVKLGGDREIRVIAGGALGGNCNFVIDVVGYYRAVVAPVA